MFLFIAPWLYAIHAVLIGLGFLAAAVLGVFIGNTDGNIIDFVVFGVMQGYADQVVHDRGAGGHLVRRLLRTLSLGDHPVRPGHAGRDDVVAAPETTTTPVPATAAPMTATPAKLVAGKYDPTAILAAIGGPDNVESLDNCITRLRMVVGDANLFRWASLKRLGAVGVIKLDDHNVQVVIGPQVQAVKDALAELIP